MVMMVSVSGLIEAMYQWCGDSAVRPYPQMLRFMAHLVLFFRNLGVVEMKKVQFFIITDLQNFYTCTHDQPPRHSVSGFRTSLYTKSLRTRYLTNCLWKFRQIYNIGAVGDTDELIRFRGQRSR